MVFNKSWAFLKSVNDWSSVGSLYGDDDDDGEPNLDKRYTPTMDNSYQKILPQDDLTLDYRTGWKGVEPVRAIRYQGDFAAGSPVSQGHYNTSFEGNTASNGFPKNSPEVDFNAPSVEAPHGETAPTGWKNRPPTDKDADYGYPDKGGWLYRDPENGAHYWYKNGVKNFMDVQEGTKGSWWSKAEDEDFDRAAGSEYDPTKIVALRGDPNKYGVASQRDSHEAKEKLSEMYLRHNKNIPPHQLVEIPMRQNIPGEQNEDYLTTARRMGIPKRKDKNSSRWSDEPIPFGKGRVKRKLEDVSDEELYGLTSEEIHDLTKGSPMEIAFQLLKDDDKSLDNPMLRERRRHILNRLEDNQNAVSDSFQGTISPKHATLSARDKRRRMFVGATGREYETREHRAAVEPSTETQEVNIDERHPYSGFSNPQTITEWAPPKPPVNPNGNEPYDEMYNQYYNVATGEPMDIAFQLLKERKSPAAFAHKLEYDKQYQKDPKRVKYREQLNAERRKRGIYGKGGADVSHTQGGKLTLESPHANRARHFKNRGTLRRVKVR